MQDRIHNKALTEIINNIENEFDVNALLYKGFKCWPFIRLQIVYHLWSARPVSVAKTVSSSKSKEQRTGIRDFVQKTRYYYAQKRSLRKQGLLPEEKRDFLFISENIERKELREGKKIHPFASSLDQMLSQKGSFQTLDYHVSQPSSYYGPFQVIDHLFTHLKLVQHREGLWKNFALPKVTNFEAFEKYLLEKNIKLPLSGEELSKKLEYIWLLSREFRSLFRRIKPKAVFFSVYFKEVNFAVSLACDSEKVRSVEIQHGHQGAFSPQNNGFARVPQEGYELLPHFFWVWGPDSAKYKQDLCQSTKHRCIVGGNPWLNSWLQQNKKSDARIRKSEVKPKVLVALQPVKEPLPVFLLEAALATQQRFDWCFRLHPVMKGRQQELIEILQKRNISFEMNETTAAPLYEVLQRSRFVLTISSTVAYEALYFGASPIIIDYIGKEIMGDYIEKGFFRYADNTKDLLKVLETTELATKGKPGFIETDQKLIMKNLDAILI